jgi:hypothetical protein
VGVVVVVVGVRGRRVWRKEVARHITYRVTTGKVCVSNNSIDSSSQWGFFFTCFSSSHNRFKFSMGFFFTCFSSSHNRFKFSMGVLLHMFLKFPQ